MSKSYTFKISILILTFLVQFVYAQTPSYSFGNTSLSADVGQMGNATVNIPIYCPPGRMGVKPNLNLSFSSSLGDGILGKGWNITGMSAITRTGRNWHLDKEPNKDYIQEAANMSYDDKFMLDGQRLLLVGGRYGDPESVYRTEVDIFAKITLHLGIVNYDSYFEVDLKDGGKAFYGRFDARIKPMYGSTSTAWEPTSWYLKRSYDRNGNFIDYSYDNSNGQILLTAINYSGFDKSFWGTVYASNPVLVPFNKVEFEYETTKHVTTQYIAGYFITQNKILKKVTTKYANITSSAYITSRVYDFSYKANDNSSTSPQYNDDIHSYLETIQETNGKGETMQPINITWTEDGSFLRKTGSANPDLDMSSTFTGDFNGDGKADLLIVYKKIDPFEMQLANKATKYEIYTFDGNNVSRILKSGFLPYDNISAILIGDVDSDGDEDVIYQTVKINKTQTSDECFLGSSFSKVTLQDITYYYYSYLTSTNVTNGNIDFNLVTDVKKPYYYKPRPVTSPTADYLTDEKQILKLAYVIPQLVEADGDGFLDLLERETIGERIVTSRCNLGGGVRETNVNSLKETKVHLALSSLSANVGNAKYYDYYATLPRMVNYIPMDFNGNGKTDFMHTFVWNDKTEILEYDNISKTFEYIYGSGQIGFPNHDHEFLHTGDFNGDGKTDLFYYVGNEWRVAYSTGTNFIEYNATSLWLGHNFSDHTCFSQIKFEIADFNGDGRDDILERHNHPSNSSYNHSANSIYIYYSTGGPNPLNQNTGFKKIFISAHANPTSANYFNLSTNLVADFDGDGKKDVLLFEPHTGAFSNSNNSILESFKQANYKLTSISNTDKHTYSFAYAPLSISSHYERTNSLYDDNTANICPAMWVVESFNSNVKGITTSDFLLDKTIQYYYRDLLYNKFGHGVMGFVQTASMDNNSDAEKKTTIVNIFKQNEDYPHHLDLKKSTTYRTNYGNVWLPYFEISQNTYYYNSIKTIPGNNINIYFSYVSYLIETHALTGQRKKTCFVYDENGNLTHTEEAYDKMGNTTGAPELRSTSDYKYETHNSWLPSSLTISHNCMMRNNGTPPYISQKEMTYNTYGNLASTEYFKNNMKYYYKEVFGYDIYGNIISNGYYNQATTSGTGLRRKLFSYDVGRFLKTTTNALGQISNFTFEEEYGNKKSETTASNLSTNYTYDAWGKLTHTDLPSGNSEDVGYEWIDNPSTNEFYYRIVKSNNAGNTSWEYYDALNRKTMVQSLGFNNTIPTQVWKYNQDQQLSLQSDIYDANASTAYLLAGTETEYDEYNRVEYVKYHGVQTAYYEYTNHSTETKVTTGTSNAPRTQISKLDATGLVESSIDAKGNAVTYKYGSHNKPLETTSNGTKVVLTYNCQLNKLSMTDPNAGKTEYDYNCFGDLIGVKDSRNNQYLYFYDDLGRLIQKTGGNSEDYSYTYFATIGQGNLNQLQKEELKINGVSKHKKEYTYTSLGLPEEVKEKAFNGLDYITHYNYDTYLRPTIISYPNIEIENHYDNLGNLLSISDVSTNADIWIKQDEEIDGKPKTIQFGNGISTNYTYDADGQLNRISNNIPNDPLDIKYKYELETGDLLEREFTGVGKETFQYDLLDRLTNLTVNNYTYPNSPGAGIKRYNYSDNGNIESIQNYGLHTLTYSTKQPHAMQSHKFDLYSPIVTSESYDEHEFTYNAFNKVQDIKQFGNQYNLHIDYGVNQERIYTKVIEISTTTVETYYVQSANMEIKNNFEYTYLYAEGVPFAIQRFNNTANTKDIFYLHLDNQGSLMVITNENGFVKEKRSYDAWGRPRDPISWKYAAVNFGAGAGITMRGYTMHEHLEMFGLINMNGRLYDPVVGRMLSADNYIQAPSNTQSYNRYSYCINNPLKYTDPSGQVFWVIPAAVALYTAYEAGRSVNGGQSDPTMWKNNSSTWTAIAVGGATGFFAGFVGAEIAASGTVLSGTFSIYMGSFINSIGMKMATLGQSHFSLSIGFASYDFEDGNLGYLGKPGNSTMEDIGYGLGAFANMSDIWAVAKGVNSSNSGKVELETDQHSIIRDENENVLLDLGAKKRKADITQYEGVFGDLEITTDYRNLQFDLGTRFHKGFFDRFQEINGVRIDKLIEYKNTLDCSGRGYGFFRIFGGKNLNCGGAAAMGLLKSGVFNIPIGWPFLLSTQMYMRQFGYTSYMFH